MTKGKWGKRYRGLFYYNSEGVFLGCIREHECNLLGTSGVNISIYCKIKSDIVELLSGFQG